MPNMTRIVGSRDRTEFTTNPVEAWHRGRVLDNMLKAAVQRPAPGVTRAVHSVLNQADDLRHLTQARKLNAHRATRHGP